MSHRSLFWPITLIAIVVATVVLLIISAPVDLGAPLISAAGPCPTDPEDPAYPSCIATLTAEAAELCPTNVTYPSSECLQTRTAILRQTEQASRTVATTSTPTSNSRTTSTRTPGLSTTPTQPTITSTPTTTPSQASDTSPPSDTPAATEAVESTDVAADAAPLVCAPGATIPIEGLADPRIGLIVTFGGRPVGGGFSRDDGSYRIWLRIGDERAGIYPVEVQERSTSEVVQSLLCEVPAFTPTPTPSLVP